MANSPRGAAAILSAALAAASIGPDLRADEPASYVGGDHCLGCHSAEAKLSKGSHHALAMQPATAATMLGNFADTKVEHLGVTTTFSRSGDKFLVRTDGSDSVLREYEIAYTFGHRSSRSHSTVTDFARLRGWSISQPFFSAT
jgi:hypothetical protein